MCQLNLLKKNKVIGKKQVIGRAIGCISAMLAAHNSALLMNLSHIQTMSGELGNDHGSYSMVSGEKYWVKDGENIGL